MSQQPGLPLALALVGLAVLALLASRVGRLGTGRAVVVAGARAVLQLAAVAVVIAAVLSSLGWSLLFVVGMFGVAVATSARRVGAARAWPWVAVAMAAGVLPVLAVVFAAGAVPWQGAALVPVAGIVIGGTMSAHSLLGRRLFAALREEHGAYEAALSIGLPRPSAIREIIERRSPEALVPGLDQTRTVGLVTLPGAFVGVLLGGGSPLQAGAAQVLVLFGLLAAQAITVAVAQRLVRAALLLPADLQRSLVP